MSLSTNLISFWELEEASGTRNDSHGTNHLIDNNTVTQTTGKVGNCGQFTKASQEYLYVADNASLSLGATAFTYVAWLYPDPISDAAGICGKWDGTSPEFAFLVDAPGGVRLTVRDAANTGYQSISASTFGNLTSNAWYFVMVQYNGTQLRISVNDGTVDTVSYSGGVNDSNGYFLLGSWADATTSWSGRIDQVGFWKRALTTGEITQLYNSGNGMTYAAILADGAGGDVTVALSGVATNVSAGTAAIPGSPIVTDLVSFWELEESIGTRNDSHGTNHLTDNGTVTQGTGKVNNAAEFLIASHNFLSRTDNASLSLGAGVQFTFCFWWYGIPNEGAGIFGKWGGTITEYAFNITSSVFRLAVRNTANNDYGLISASTFGTPPSSTWCFVMCQYTGATLKISVNDGTVDSVAYSGDVIDSNGTFVIGAYSDGTTNMTGRVDQFGFWKRALTTTEITYLYNSGAGRTYAAISGGATTLALTGVRANASVEEFDLPGPAQEPQLYYDTTYTAPTGATITVGPTGNFQTALNAANPGDVIVLNAGSTYTGNFSLPNKGSTGFYIHIVSSASLTPVGVRITTSQAASFPKIVTNIAQAVIQTDIVSRGTSYYRFINCELTSTVAFTGSLIGLGDGNETSDSQFPHHIIIDRCYVHGHATLGGRRGVMFCGSYQAVIDSYVSDWKEVGADTQAIGCWNGRGPYKITNNYLEAAGENVMFGGDVTLIEGLTPSDIEVRNNYFFKPLSWKVGHVSYAGTHWSIKNIFELKHASRVIVENNLFENCWADSQVGFGIVITVRTDDYGSGYWTAITDVIFRNNEVRNSDNGINFIGEDDLHPSGTARRALISDNLLTGIDGPLGSDGIFCQILNGYRDITINHNTCLHGGNTIITDGAASPRLTFTNNICQHGLYGILGSGYGSGNATIAHFFPSSVITKNVIQSATDYSSTYPVGNFWPTTLDPGVGFTNYPTDLSLSPSSPYHNAGTDSTDIGYVAGVPAAPAFKAAFAASSNQIIV